MQHFAVVPPAAISRVLASFSRNELAGFVSVAIDLMDLVDGDSDLEEVGAEDSFQSHDCDGPGCPLGDPDSCEDADRGERVDEREEDPAEDGRAIIYGADQSRPVSADNPSLN